MMYLFAFRYNTEIMTFFTLLAYEPEDSHIDLYFVARPISDLEEFALRIDKNFLTDFA